MSPEHTENVAELACRTALARRGVAHITMPVDYQHQDVTKKRSKRNVPGHTSDVYAVGARLPSEADLNRAADILTQGKKIAILAGQGALQATDQLEQIADKLGA